WLVDIQSPKENAEVLGDKVDISGRLTLRLKIGFRTYDETDRDMLETLPKEEQDKILAYYEKGPKGEISCGGVKGVQNNKDWEVKNVPLPKIGVNRIECQFVTGGRITRDWVNIKRVEDSNNPPVMIGDSPIGL